MRQRSGAPTTTGGGRYLLLALVVGAMGIVASVFNQPSGGDDFWEHSAVVRELAAHPFAPRQPFLGVHQPDVFFTPYSLVVGLFSRVTGLGPVTSLKIAGIANLVLFLVAFPHFVRAFTAHRQAPFWSMLCMLFLWGTNPWDYSAFFHLNAFGGVLSFPSTFATAVALLAVAAWKRYLDHAERRWLAWTAVGTALVVITHPVAAVFLLAAIGALTLGRSPSEWRRLAIRLLLVGTVVALLALAWPYYPVVHLLSGSLYASRNRVMYENVLAQTFPALLGVPVVVGRLRRRRNDSLALLVLLLLVFYVYGWIAEAWDYGRVISFLVLALQIGVADWVAGHERWIVKRRGTARLAVGVGVVALAVPALLNMGPGLAAAVPRPLLPHVVVRHYRLANKEFADYPALFAGTRSDEVTLAEPADGWGIPTYGGEVVATLKPQAFVDDLSARAAAVTQFFAAATTGRDRRSIIDRYDVTFVLLRINSHPPDGLAPVATIESLGRVERSVGKVELIRVR